MSKSDTTLIAIGGGDIAKAEGIVDEILGLLKDKSDPRITVMTIATNEPESAGRKYDSLFRSKGINHVSIVDISERDDSFSEAALKRIDKSDALFFTGGNQLNVTSLLGGTPLHNLIHEKVEDGFIIAGTSAGATMMSNSMIVSGRSDDAPKVGCVEIAAGMDLVSETIIDTHFSQRGRHGRLLAAIAHYPQDLGIGIDERTAIVVRRSQFRVIGDGVVTVMDGSRMKHSNLAYRDEGEPLGLFDVCTHILPEGYKYDLKRREPVSPALTKLVGSANNKG